jgi:hypothetical protein
MAPFDPSKIAPSAPLRFGARSATRCDYFDYGPGQPNLYLLMRLKLWLVRTYGVDEGYLRYRNTIARHHDATLELRKLSALSSFAASHAEEYIEIEPAGEAVIVEPPRVVGGGNHRPLSNTGRSLYLARLKDAAVRGRSSIVQVADLALLDFEPFELARIDDQIEFDSAVFARRGDMLSMIAEQHSPDPTELTEAISLLGARTDFFGDWMCDNFLKFVAAIKYQLPPSVPVLIDADMPKSHRQSVEMMTNGERPIIEVSAFDYVNVQNLWCAPSLGYMPLYQVVNERFKWDYLVSPPDRCFSVLKEMTRRADLYLGPARGPVRVFLARRDFRHRRLINAQEIQAIAESRGFVIVYPEDLEFSAQAQLLRTAQFVIGPEGSAFFLTYFQERGNRMCVLSHPFTEALVGYNAGCMPGEVTIVTGSLVAEHHENTLDADYVINAKIFSVFLDEWLNERDRVNAVESFER